MVERGLDGFSIRLAWRRAFARAPRPHLHVEPQFAPRRAESDTLPTGLRRALLSYWEKRERSWLTLFVILSVLLHVLIVALLLLFAGREEHPVAEIVPVKLVTLPPAASPAEKQQQQPPPPKQEAQKQEKKQQQPPPPKQGRLASDELGDVNATAKDPTPDHLPAAGMPSPRSGEAPIAAGQADPTPKPSEQAPPDQVDKPNPDPAIEQQQIDKTPEQTAMGGVMAPPPPSQEPRRDESAKPAPKPAELHLRADQGGAKKVTLRPDAPNQAEGHKAKYPGPDATYDEYLAYIRDLTNQHLAQVPLELTHGRSGTAVYEVRVRPNGVIVWFALVRSSGHPDSDRAITAALNSIDKFPPLPPEVLDKGSDSTPLQLSLPLSYFGRER